MLRSKSLRTDRKFSTINMKKNQFTLKALMEVRIKHKYHLLRKMQVILTKWIFHATINQFRKVTNSFRGAAAASSASTAVSPGNPTWPAGRQVAATGFGRISPFLSVHKTFSRIDHILGYKFSLGKFKKN